MSISGSINHFLVSALLLTNVHVNDFQLCRLLDAHSSELLSDSTTFTSRCDWSAAWAWEQRHVSTFVLLLLLFYVLVVISNISVRFLCDDFQVRLWSVYLGVQVFTGCVMKSRLSWTGSDDEWVCSRRATIKDQSPSSWWSNLQNILRTSAASVSGHRTQQDQEVKWKWRRRSQVRFYWIHKNNFTRKQTHFPEKENKVRTNCTRCSAAHLCSL